MAPHSSTFAQKIPWTEEPGRLQSMGSLESDTTERRPFHFSLSCIGEGNDPTPVFLPGESQGREAWWAAVYGAAQSRTRLKRLSSSSSVVAALLRSLCPVGSSTSPALGGGFLTTEPPGRSLSIYFKEACCQPLRQLALTTSGFKDLMKKTSNGLTSEINEFHSRQIIFHLLMIKNALSKSKQSTALHPSLLCFKIKHRNNFSKYSITPYHREKGLLLGQTLHQIFEKNVS